MAKAKWGVNTYVKITKPKIGRHKKNLNKDEVNLTVFLVWGKRNEKVQEK